MRREAAQTEVLVHWRSGGVGLEHVLLHGVEVVSLVAVELPRELCCRLLLLLSVVKSVQLLTLGRALDVCKLSVSQNLRLVLLLRHFASHYAVVRVIGCSSRVLLVGLFNCRILLSLNHELLLLVHYLALSKEPVLDIAREAVGVFFFENLVAPLVNQVALLELKILLFNLFLIIFLFLQGFLFPLLIFLPHKKVVDLAIKRLGSLADLGLPSHLV